MSLIDMVSRVTSIYKADTTQHRAAIRELSGEQKKAAQEELKRIEGSNAGVDRQIKALGKLAIIVGSVGVAAKIAFDSLEFAGRRADLQATANIESMDGLKAATRGLMTETQLLEASAKIQQGTMKLSQKELENVTGAMTALGEKGNDTAAVTEAFTTALVTGKTEGLKAFGIEVYEGGNRLETHNAILAKAAELTREFSKDQLDGADKMSVAKNKFADATDNLKVSIGKAAESLTPLVDGFASLVKSLTDVGAVGPVAIGLLGLAITGNPAIAAILALGAAGGNSYDEITGAGRKQIDRRNRKMGIDGLRAAQTLEQQVMGMRSGLEMDDASVGVISLADMKKDASRYASLLEERRKLSDAYAKRITDEFLEENGESYIKGWAGPGQDRSADQNPDSFRVPQGEVGIDWEGTHANIELAGTLAKDALAELDNQPTLLEKMLGTPDEFDVYRSALQGVTDAMAGAYEAIVTGSEPAGKAFKRIIASGIMATGKMMFVDGLKETAHAIGSLASQNYAGAGMHAAAAAKYFAGAAVAGAVASQLGGGGGGGVSSGGGARPSAPSYNGPSGNAPGDRSAPVIVVGSPFAYDSPRNQQKNAKRLTGLALGTNSVTYG